MKNKLLGVTKTVTHGKKFDNTVKTAIYLYFLYICYLVTLLPCFRKQEIFKDFRFLKLYKFLNILKSNMLYMHIYMTRHARGGRY